MNAYVYIWFSPEWVPFYVGMGKTPTRWNPICIKKKDRNSYCFRLVEKYGRRNVRVQRITGLDWNTAASIEQSLIAHFGRKSRGGALVNFSDGGEGNTNPSDEERERRRKAMLDPAHPAKEALRKKNADPDFQKRRIAAQTAPAIRAKTAASLKALWSSLSPEDRDKRLSGMRGPRSLKQRAIVAEAKRQWWADHPERRVKKKVLLSPEEISARISEGVRRAQPKRLITMYSPEVQAKLHRPKTAEHNAKNSAAQKLRWAKRKASLAL